MHLHQLNQHICRIVVLLLAGLAQPVLAQQSAAAFVNELNARYPKGSITEVGQADQALAGVVHARSLAEAQYAAEQRECFPRFFATDCLDSAKERRRDALNRIAPIEIEANMFKRKANVAERDKALAEKQAKETTEAEERAKKQQENEKSVSEKSEKRGRAIAEDKARQANPPPAAPSKEEQHAVRMQALQAEEQRKAPEREKNAAAYQRKAQQAAERQRSIAEKKQQKAAAKAAASAAPQQ